jgi:hypothetical protein
MIANARYAGSWVCAPEPGKDAFHCVPDSAWNEWDAVERVLTAPGGKFTGREKTSGAAPGCAAN